MLQLALQSFIQHVIMDISVEPQKPVWNFRTVGGLAASALLSAPAKSPYTAHVARKHLTHSSNPTTNLQRYLSMVHHRWTNKPFPQSQALCCFKAPSYCTASLAHRLTCSVLSCLCTSGIHKLPALAP